MAQSVPKAHRRLARDGVLVDAVITGFAGTTADDVSATVPQIRWLLPDGTPTTHAQGLSIDTDDPRGRGDVLRLLVPADGARGRTLVLAEPAAVADEMERRLAGAKSWDPRVMARSIAAPRVAWGTRTEGVVVAVEAQPEGGSRVRVTFAGRTELLGPSLAAPDPRRVGDVVDVGLDDQGAVVRPPSGPAPGAEERRSAMARKPGLLKRIWESEWI